MSRRLNLLPRLRQACRRDPADAASADVRGGQRSSAGAGAPCGHPSLSGATGARQGRELNRLFLSGVLADHPQPDRDRNGDPVTFLLIAFPAPDSSDTRERIETASCEIEVPEPVTEHHGTKKLRTGASIFITGQLSGGGGILADGSTDLLDHP